MLALSAISGIAVETGWRCAQRLDRSRRPFRFAVERRSIDSDIRQAVGRAPDGVRYVLSYDSNPSGGSGLSPRFTRDRCPDDVVFARTPHGTFACGRRAR